MTRGGERTRVGLPAGELASAGADEPVPLVSSAGADEPAALVSRGLNPHGRQEAKEEPTCTESFRDHHQVPTLARLQEQKEVDQGHVNSIREEWSWNMAWAIKHAKGRKGDEGKLLQR